MNTVYRQATFYLYNNLSKLNESIIWLSSIQSYLIDKRCNSLSWGSPFYLESHHIWQEKTTYDRVAPHFPADLLFFKKLLTYYPVQLLVFFIGKTLRIYISRILILCINMHFPTSIRVYNTTFSKQSPMYIIHYKLLPVFEYHRLYQNLYWFMYCFYNNVLL